LSINLSIDIIDLQLENKTSKTEINSTFQEVENWAKKLNSVFDGGKVEIDMISKYFEKIKYFINYNPKQKEISN
jgi:predicted esterase YcpF (UPF0227 family)